MKTTKKRKISLLPFLFYLPELFLITFLGICFLEGKDKYFYIFIGIGFFFFLRILFFFTKRAYFYKPRLEILRRIISDFKNGDYIYSANTIAGNDILAGLIKSLVSMGIQIEKTINSKKNEIESFREFYSNIVLSAESHLIVLDEDERIVFANQQFCKYFHLEEEYVLGKKLDNIFYYINPHFRDGIFKIKNGEDHITIKKLQFMFSDKISITADINITLLNSWEKNHIVIVVDDISSETRKDQLSIMDRITKSMESGNVIEQVFSTILTGITSGSGLGFNRAMLFLVEDDALIGKMAVGPDSFEEAIEIWSTLSKASSAEEKNAIPDTGKHLTESVIQTSFPMSADNLFVNALIKNESQHIYDSYNDNRVENKVKQLMDVKEFVVMPISAMNIHIGVIVADNKFNRMPISDYNIELLSMFAIQAAFSIETYNRLTLLENEMDKLKRKQDAIVEAEKMAAVGRIAAHISHEIRNPLVTMGGYARHIINTPQKTKQAEDDIKRSGRIILEESERLEKILSNVMDFTRPATDTREFNDINEVIEDTINLFHNYFLEKNIILILEKGEDMPLVKVDFNQMKQVILNLIQNSVDAMPSGGYIEIITFYEDENIIIKVRDNGPGFSTTDIDKLFTPFFTTKTAGIGLGLSNVKKIIMNHMGSIEAKNLVESEGGAEFTIALPV